MGLTSREIGLNPIETPEGRFVLASIVDITERKAVDDKLHEAYAEVQQENREMEQFVYTVSRVPVIVLSTLQDPSLRKSALEQGAQDYLCKGDLSPELLCRTIEHAIERH
jgi:DNA-binding NarL/FixJ family response regulator